MRMGACNDTCTTRVVNLLIGCWLGGSRSYNPGVPLTNVNQLRAGQLSQFGITLGMQEMMSADSVFHSTAQGCPPGFGGVSPVCVRCDEGVLACALCGVSIRRRCSPTGVGPCLVWLWQASTRIRFPTLLVSAALMARMPTSTASHASRVRRWVLLA